MKRESAVFSVMRGVLLTVFSLSITVQPAAWEWPATGTDFTLDADGSDSSLHTGPNWSFRFVNRSGGDVPVIAPISGELVFIDEVRSSENREGDLLVIRNANELWVNLRVYGIAWADRSFLLAETVSTGDTLGRAEVVELEVYDRLGQQYVNPRALFPYTDRFPGDGLPPLTFLQSGVVRDPRQTDARYGASRGRTSRCSVFASPTADIHSPGWFASGSTFLRFSRRNKLANNS